MPSIFCASAAVTSEIEFVLASFDETGFRANPINDGKREAQKKGLGFYVIYFRFELDNA